MQFLSAFKVQSISVLPNKTVEVVFQAGDHDPVRFCTRKFGVGRRGVKTAALAKFASDAGFGEAEELYRYLLRTPRDHVGEVFFQLVETGLETAPEDTPLRCVWPDEQVA